MVAVKVLIRLAWIESKGGGGFTSLGCLLAIESDGSSCGGRGVKRLRKELGAPFLWPWHRKAESREDIRYAVRKGEKGESRIERREKESLQIRVGGGGGVSECYLLTKGGSVRLGLNGSFSRANFVLFIWPFRLPIFNLSSSSFGLG